MKFHEWLYNFDLNIDSNLIGQVNLDIDEHVKEDL